MAHHYEIIVVPEHGENPRHFNVSAFGYAIIRLAIAFVIATIIFVIAGWGIVAQRLIAYEDMKNQNDSLLHISEQIDSLAVNYASLMGDLRYLQMITQIPHSEDLPEREMFQTKPVHSNSETTGDTKTAIASVPGILPVAGVVTQKFEAKGKNEHMGVDFSAPHGAPIKATADGVIENHEFDNYLGNVITINHGSGYVTEYAHCSQLLAPIGKRVKRGDIIALVGSSGKSSGPHLHYVVKQNKIPVNPSQFF